MAHCLIDYFNFIVYYFNFTQPFQSFSNGPLFSPALSDQCKLYHILMRDSQPKIISLVFSSDTVYWELIKIFGNILYFL